MTERPNVPVLKTGVGLPTVGSNPTPSAILGLAHQPDHTYESWVERGQQRRQQFFNLCRFTMSSLVGIGERLSW
jgi:hypothetical protein